MMASEEKRVAELKAAQTKAEDLFYKVETRSLIRPGTTEGELKPKRKRDVDLAFAKGKRYFHETLDIQIERPNCR